MPTPEPTPTPNPAPTPEPVPIPKPENNPEPTPASFSQADIDRAVKKATADAEKRAKMSEDERKDARIAELEAQGRERDTKDAVQTEAAKLGAKNSGLIYKAIKDDLTFDKDGKPENLKDVLTQSKKDYPELFGEKSNGSADGGEGKTPSANNSLDNQIRQALGLT